MPNKPFALHCHTSPLAGEGFMEDFTDYAERVRVSRRRQGGLWDMSFIIPGTLSGGEKVARSVFQDWFSNRLFYVIRQIMGASIFEGVVWMIDLTLDGITMRRDYGEMYNAVRVDYTEEDGTQNKSAWFTDAGSIAKYGRKELIAYMRNATSTQADDEAQTILTTTAEAWPRPINIDERRDNQLEVFVAGKVFTGNNKFVGTTTFDGGSGNLDVLISSLIANDMEFLSEGSVDTNAIQYRRALSQPIRAWDMLTELTAIGDGSVPYASGVRLGGIVDYKAVDPQPKVFWDGQKMGITMMGRPITKYDAWTLEPNVIRDRTRAATAPVPGSFLQQANDSWIFEVEMADGLEQPVLKPDEYEDDEVMRAMRLYQIWLESKWSEDPVYWKDAREYPVIERLFT
jgi:hypothetical protein